MTTKSISALALHGEAQPLTMSTESSESNSVHQLLSHCDFAALEYLLPMAPRLELMMKRRFGSRIDIDDIKDIVAGALIDAVDHGHMYDPTRGSLEAWLSVRAHYAALTFLRRHPEVAERAAAALDEIEQSDLTADAPDQPDQGPSPRMLSALTQLSRTHSRMLIEYYYQGWSEADIAYRHQLAASTVRSQLSRARQALKQALTPND